MQPKESSDQNKRRRFYDHIRKRNRKEDLQCSHVGNNRCDAGDGSAAVWHSNCGNDDMSSHASIDLSTDGINDFTVQSVVNGAHHSRLLHSQMSASEMRAALEEKEKEIEARESSARWWNRARPLKATIFVSTMMIVLVSPNGESTGRPNRTTATQT